MLKSFFAMGGYGIWIWPAYGITLIVFLIIFFDYLREKKFVHKEIVRELCIQNENEN